MGRFVAPSRRFRVLSSAFAAATAVLLLAPMAAAADDDPTDDPDFGQTFANSSTTFGGASVLATSRTVQHWSGQTENGDDHVTYHYNMVGVDPSTDGSTTIGVDIIPVNVNVAGQAFNGSERVAAVLGSPIFTYRDYTRAAFATRMNGGRGTGGNLVANNTYNQLLDATMRVQFNKSASSGYHLNLGDVAVQDAVTIDVPDGQGVTSTSPGMITYGLLDAKWFQTRIQNQMGRLQLDPTRLALFLTWNIVLFTDNDPFSTAHCCTIGAHGAGSATGQTSGSAHGNGNQPVQTFVWSSWLTPGWFSPATQWAQRDIYGLSHEIVEWATNPFGDNTVQPWFSGLAPQYGCSDELETGDPVLNVGFSIGRNTFEMNRFTTTDPGFHPSDEALLPWFMRSSPETQGGRFTFMGSLNPFPAFHAAATGCPS